MTTKKMGRPLTVKSAIEALVMKQQIMAQEAYEKLQGAAADKNVQLSPLGQELLEIFKRMEETASMTQAIHQGLRTMDHEFNSQLALFLGEENLN